MGAAHVEWNGHEYGHWCDDLCDYVHYNLNDAEQHEQKHVDEGRDGLPIFDGESEPLEFKLALVYGVLLYLFVVAFGCTSGPTVVRESAVQGNGRSLEEGTVVAAKRIRSRPLVVPRACASCPDGRRGRFLRLPNVDHCCLRACQNVGRVWVLKTAVGRLRLMIAINVLPHLVARRRVLLVFALVVAILRQLLQELLLESQGQLVNADMEVTGSLRIALLLLFDSNSQRLRLGHQLRSRQRLLLLLLLFELNLLYL